MENIAISEIGFDRNMMRASGLFNDDDHMEAWILQVTEEELPEYNAAVQAGTSYIKGAPIISDRPADRIDGKRYIFMGWSET